MSAAAWNRRVFLILKLSHATIWFSCTGSWWDESQLLRDITHHCFKRYCKMNMVQLIALVWVNRFYFSFFFKLDQQICPSNRRVWLMKRLCKDCSFGWAITAYEGPSDCVFPLFVCFDPSMVYLVNRSISSLGLWKSPSGPHYFLQVPLLQS